MRPCNLRSLLLAAIVLSNCITWTASKQHFTHNVSGHRSRHRRQGTGLYLPSSYVLPGGEGAGWGEWGEVSPCSRSCGGGVASQKRICLQVGSDGNHQCTGGDTKYFSCETQDCPDGSPDFRAEQCSEFDNHTFRSKKYIWEPFLNGPNPCELNCMPHGERFYYRHKAAVVDGTRCNDESNDVCVQGTCQPVGCDMMLGSTAKEDKCRVCRGNGVNCYTATGVIDRQDLVKGYNDIMLIPEGASNIMIAEVKPSSNYLALQAHNTSVYYLNGDYHIDFPRNLEIDGSVWRYERNQHGFPAPDKLRCLGPITKPLYLSLLLQDVNVGIEYEYSLPRALAPRPKQIYNWVHSDFTECSASCGGGVQQRNVTCSSRDELEPVDEALCDAPLKPATSQPCNRQPCPAQWVEGPWSACSKPCGDDGTRSRKVYCQKIINTGEDSSFPSVVADKECFDILGNKPELFQECNRNATCPTWFIGNWSPCDKLCGEGNQTRKVVCRQVVDGKVKVFDDSQCLEEKPATEQTCTKQLCEGVAWVFSEWTGCDTCLSKNRTRQAECITEDRVVVNSSFCSFYESPVLEEPCDKEPPPCIKEWYATQWSPCSVKCGNGTQKRRVFCGSFDGKQVTVVDDSECDPLTRYQDTKPCVVPYEQCPAQWYIGPWRPCEKCSKGDQLRDVLCLQNGTIVNSTLCDSSSFLESSQSCNEPCEATSSTPGTDDDDDDDDEGDYCDDFPEMGIDIVTPVSLGGKVKDSLDEGSGMGDPSTGDFESTFITVSPSKLGSSFSLSSDDLIPVEGSGDISITDFTSSLNATTDDLGSDNTTRNDSATTESLSTEISNATTSNNTDTTTPGPGATLLETSEDSNLTTIFDTNTTETDSVTLIPINATLSTKTTHNDTDTTVADLTTPEPTVSSLSNITTEADTNSTEDASATTIVPTIEVSNVTTEADTNTTETGTAATELSTKASSNDTTDVDTNSTATTELSTSALSNGTIDVDTNATIAGSASTIVATTEKSNVTTDVDTNSTETASATTELPSSVESNGTTIADTNTTETDLATKKLSTSALSKKTTNIDTDTTIAASATTIVPTTEVSNVTTEADTNTTETASATTILATTEESNVTTEVDNSTTITASATTILATTEESNVTTEVDNSTTITASATTILATTEESNVTTEVDNSTTITASATTILATTEESNVTTEVDNSTTVTDGSTTERSSSPLVNETTIADTNTTVESSATTEISTSALSNETTDASTNTTDAGSTATESSTDSKISSADTNTTEAATTITEEANTNSTDGASATTVVPTSEESNGTTSAETVTTVADLATKELTSSALSNKTTNIDTDTTIADGVTTELSTSPSLNETTNADTNTTEAGTATTELSTSALSNETTNVDSNTTAAGTTKSSSDVTTSNIDTNTTEAGSATTIVPTTEESNVTTEADTNTTETASATTVIPTSEESNGTTSADTVTTIAGNVSSDVSTTELSTSASSNDTTNADTNTTVAGSATTELSTSALSNETTDVDTNTTAAGSTTESSSNVTTSSVDTNTTEAGSATTILPTSEESNVTTEADTNTTETGTATTELSTSALSNETTEVDTNTTETGSIATESSSSFDVTTSSVDTNATEEVIETTATIAESFTTTEVSTSGGITPWTLSSTVLDVTSRVCRPRKFPKCFKSKYGCCLDRKTEAKGAFQKGCPSPVKTCNGTTHGCCPDGVSPALGPNNEGCPIPACSETLYGCCASDNKTAAEGNDQEGCPPACRSSEFGCCEDDETPAVNEDKSNCPERSTIAPTTVSACVGSTHGCCYDNVTEATGPNGEGCPCNTTEFGCCSDGVSAASGPLSEGCPGACGSSAHGCCPDGVTPAHGPAAEGCCVASPYGCCPDNYNNALGPHMEGCNCQNAHYGCCPDNSTVARGSNYEGCGCQYSKHGCCPDRHTEASGPEYKGCDCNTFQYGCCPDGVTAATGPSFQGCHCRDSKYGCCGDGETPAVGPNLIGCDCSSSMHGCCADGKTAARGPKFYGCAHIPENKQAACGLPTERGPCRNFSIYWFYDVAYGGCSRFWYGGCGGNGNKFETKDECEDVCINPPATDLCKLPKVKGPCVGHNIHWYYDSERQQCAQFYYGGCLGNSNNFVSRQLCQEQCEPERKLNQCNLPIERGPCNGTFNRWGFNTEKQQCDQFLWGGCEGNSNRFTSEAACTMQCNPPGTLKPICKLQQAPGNCTEKHAQWSFSETENRCLPFYYTGCMGNDNRFDSYESCENACPSAYEPNECTLPVATGECGNYREKWYYDTREKACRRFFYGGCGGNTNNFDSQYECESRCRESVVVTTVQPPEEQRSEYCFLETDPGSCSKQLKRWTYDYDLGKCVDFVYGGCGGNRNNFLTEESCQQYCKPSQDICQLPMLSGPCDESLMRWFYDATSDSCSQFTYGGCQGNYNRFKTKDSCERRCKTTPLEETTTPDITTISTALYSSSSTDSSTEPANITNSSTSPAGTTEFSTSSVSSTESSIISTTNTSTSDFSTISAGTTNSSSTAGSTSPGSTAAYWSTSTIAPSSTPAPLPEDCVVSVDLEECTGAGEVWFIDPAVGGCVPHDNADSGNTCRNTGVFLSQEDCEISCGIIIENDECKNAPQAGVCRSRYRMWYYDPSIHDCRQFDYTGCGGNNNRFERRDDCMSYCRTRVVVAVTPTAAVSTTGTPIISTTSSSATSFSTISSSAASSSTISSSVASLSTTTNTTIAPSSTTAEPNPDGCAVPERLEQCVRAGLVWFLDVTLNECMPHVNAESGDTCRNTGAFTSQEACERSCGAFRDIDVCRSVKDPGLCRNFVPKFYFDMELRRCREFAYGGCRGGPNRFSTLEECMQVCQPYLEPACHQNPEQGSCTSRYIMWYYDKSSDQCGKFIYTGCGGNNNRFESREECENKCRSPKNVDVLTTTSVPPVTEIIEPVDEQCRTPHSLAPCGSNSTVWYYDSENKRCVESNIGGCRNANSYRTEEECERQCGAFIDSNPCKARLDAGPCRESIVKYYWDSASGKCLDYAYSGCFGGPNRFSTIDECEEVCGDSGPDTDEVIPADCDEYNAECSRLQCAEGVERTRTEEGCERCACREPADPCAATAAQCAALRCDYGLDRTTDQNGCPVCKCLEHPCAIISCSAGQRCVPSAYRDPVTQEPKYTATCEIDTNEVIPVDCDEYNAECSRLQCAEGVERTRTEEGCERCACREPADPCAATAAQCAALRCDYGLDRTTDQNGCPVCKCLEHPCAIISCPAGQRCVPSAYRDPVTQEPKYTATCEIDTNEVIPVDCDEYNAECSRLQCAEGVERTRTEEGCERCACREPADPCAATAAQCAALRCDYGLDRTTDQNGCPVCRCLEHPCTSVSCPAGQRCVPRAYQDTDTRETKYTAACEIESPVEEESCAQLEAECAALRCEFNVQRTRTALGCERCACVRLEVDCSLHAAECQPARCPYGILAYKDDNGCDRCKCKNHPCADVTCEPGKRCVTTSFTDPITMQTKYTATCNLVNKPGSCPPQELSQSTEGSCRDECADDAACRGVGKCCARGCRRRCVAPAPTPTPLDPPPHAPDAPHPPEVSPKTKPEVVAAEGGKATLRCLFHSNPPPRITWTRGEIRIDGNVGRYRLLSDGALEIVSLYRNDSGVYICVADNGLGIARQQVRLQVSDPVEAAVGISGEQNAMVTGEIGRPLAIRCLAYGYPAPSVFWYRGLTGPMVPFSSTQYESRGNILRIKQLSIATLGEYACQAYNGIGPAKPVSWSVVVRAYRPAGYTLDSEYLVDGGQVIEPSPDKYEQEGTTVTTTSTTPEPYDQNMFTVTVTTKLSALYTTITTGAELSLPCEVDGYPDPDIYWTKDGVRLQNSDRISISGTSVSRLTVSSVTPADAGTYACHAANDYSSHTSSVLINVQGLVIPAKCTDNKFFADCRLIVRSKFCNHRYYSKFCCKSCMEAGELNPLDFEQNDQSWSDRRK